jgi:hypothetical protein
MEPKQISSPRGRAKTRVRKKSLPVVISPVARDAVTDQKDTIYFSHPPGKGRVYLCLSSYFSMIFWAMP